MSSTTILQRLRQDPNWSQSLAKIVVDQTLAQKTQSWLNPPELSKLASAAFEQISEHPELPTHLEAFAKRLLNEGHLDFPEPVGDRLPMTLVHPLQVLLEQKDYSPHRQLVKATLDHPAMQELLREMLIAEVSSFGRKFRGAWNEQSQRLPGGRLANRLAGVAKGVASVVGSELERQIEERARDFVGEALQQSTQKLIDRICSPDFAPELARWRVGVLHALLALPGKVYQHELSQLKPDQAAQSLVELWQSIAAWPQSQEVMEQSLRLGIELWSESTGQELLEELGLLDSMRSTLLRYAEQGISATFQCDAFAAWLEALVQDLESPAAKV